MTQFKLFKMHFSLSLSLSDIELWKSIKVNSVLPSRMLLHVSLDECLTHIHCWPPLLFGWGKRVKFLKVYKVNKCNWICIQLVNEGADVMSNLSCNVCNCALIWQIQSHSPLGDSFALCVLWWVCFFLCLFSHLNPHPFAFLFGSPSLPG